MADIVTAPVITATELTITFKRQVDLVDLLTSINTNLLQHWGELGHTTLAFVRENLSEAGPTRSLSHLQSIEELIERSVFVERSGIVNYRQDWA